MYLRMKSALLLLSLLTVIYAFDIRRVKNSMNHQEITRIAILRATEGTCKKTVPGFTTPTPLNAETLVKACKQETHKNHFQKAISVICYHNVKTDLTHALAPKYHFDRETFNEGKKLITDGLNEITKQVKDQHFDQAREKLGEILHTLQDFYSHSNWIELGNTTPYTALINPHEEMVNIAAKDQKTCEEDSKKSQFGAKLLQNILENKILTSGYFGKNKPKGKCSHGGLVDFTTGRGKSWDGINKDSHSSSHGSLHDQAANVAIDASVGLLENIRDKINNDDNFLRLMGLRGNIPKGALKALLFLAFKDRYPNAIETPNEIIIEEITEL